MKRLVRVSDGIRFNDSSQFVHVIDTHYVRLGCLWADSCAPRNDFIASQEGITCVSKDKFCFHKGVKSQSL